MHKTKHIDRTKLTEREAEVMALREQGLSYEEIGEKLHISPGTASNKAGSARKRLRAKEHLSGQ